MLEVVICKDGRPKLPKIELWSVLGVYWEVLGASGGMVFFKVQIVDPNRGPKILDP